MKPIAGSAGAARIALADNPGQLDGRAAAEHFGGDTGLAGNDDTQSSAAIVDGRAEAIREHGDAVADSASDSDELGLDDLADGAGRGHYRKRQGPRVAGN